MNGRNQIQMDADFYGEQCHSFIPIFRNWFFWGNIDISDVEEIMKINQESFGLVTFFSPNISC